MWREGVQAKASLWAGEEQTYLSCPSCEGWVELCPDSVSPGVRSVELPPALGFCPPTPPLNPEEEVVFI